jgi:uncharacterized protein (DUF983 family)
MELDDLKGTWTVLEERLKKNEMLNKQIMEEMLRKKSKKSLNGLINLDFFGLVVMLLVIPICIWLYHAPYFANLLSLKIFSVSMTVFFFLLAIWYCYKLRCAMKIDFSKQVKSNMSCVSNYAVLLKWEKLATYFVLLPVVGLSAGFLYYELNASFSLWVFLIVALIIAIIGEYWLYKRFYDANIQSVKEGLEEMKNWEE